MTDFGVNVHELNDIIDCLNQALEVFGLFGYHVTSMLVDELGPAMQWIDPLLAIEEGELLTSEEGHYFAEKRISLPFLLARDSFRETGSDMYEEAQKAAETYKRLREGEKEIEYASLFHLKLFLETLKLVLTLVIKEVSEMDEQFDLVVLDVELERALENPEYEIPGAEEAGGFKELTAQLIQEKIDDGRFKVLLFVEQLRDDIRRYSLLAPQPSRPNPLGRKYDEDGIPNEYDPLLPEILDKLHEVDGVYGAGYMGGSIFVFKVDDYDWKEDMIDATVIAIITGYLGLDCLIQYESEDLASDDDNFEGVGA